MQLSLEVRGKRNLEESLDFYVSGELMEGDNQYYCEEIGRKVEPGSLFWALNAWRPCHSLLRICQM